MNSWLIDKSVIGRLHGSAVAAEWAERIERGLVRISTVTRIEVGFSARSAADHRSSIAVADGVDQQTMDQTPILRDEPFWMLFSTFIDSATITIAPKQQRQAAARCS